MHLIILLALTVAGVTAQADDSTMEHVLVSVPIHKKTAATALPASTLSGEVLRRAAAGTIGETLANSPGLTNGSYGPAVGRPVIRGQQGARVTVLQNSLSSADASTNSADHAISVEPVLADSVEVLRGPGTLLYGGGAIGGVVNVLDNRIPSTALSEPSGGIEYRYDDALSLDNLAGRLEGGNGRFAFHTSGLHREWEEMEIPGYALRDLEAEENYAGFVPNSGGETSTFNLGGALHYSKGWAGLSVSRLENEYGIPAGGHGHHEEEQHHQEEEEFHQEEGNEDEQRGIRLDIEQTRYDATLQLDEPLPGFETLRGSLSYNDYEHAEIEGSGEVGAKFASDTWASRLELTHLDVGRLHGLLGLQWTVNEFSAIGEEAFVPKTDSTELGLFLLEDYHAGGWIFEFGLRYDSVERKPDSELAAKRDFDNLSLSGSALRMFSPGWKISLGLSHNERAPVTEELFSNVEASGEHELIVHGATGAVEVGDPDLDQEVSNNLNVSLGWSRDTARVMINLFYNDFEDYIALANTGKVIGEASVQTYVQDDAVFYGGEFEAGFSLAQVLGGGLMLDLNADAVRGELDQLGNAPRLPPYRTGMELHWDNDQLFLFLRVLKAASQDRAGAFEEATSGYTRWDAGAEYRIGLKGAADLLLFARFKNIGDEEIRLSTSFLRDLAPEAGRSLETGIRFSF